jgi:hypothetical protein
MYTPFRAAALATVAVSLAAAAKADAAAPPSVSFSTPATGAVVSGGQVRVRLKASSRTTRLRVFAGPTEVTKRFTRRGRVWSGTIPRSQLSPGTDKLLAQAFAGKTAGTTASVKVIVTRKAAVKLSVTTGRTITLRTATPMLAKLTLNGHRVADLRAGMALNDRSWTVSRRDGLRTGRNTFALTAYDSSGRYATRRWTTTVKAPRAEAGAAERTATPGSWTRLDGSKSRAAVKYRWRVVKAPKGSKPSLKNATAAKPSFKPDKPGIYKLALTTTTAGGSSSQDTTTVAAAPSFGAQGLYVGTDLEPNPNDGSNYATMYIAGVPYTSTTPSGTADIFVQLDAKTLAPVATGTDATITPAAGTITIGVWNNYSIASSKAIYGSRVWIGTTMVADNEAFNPSPWSGNATSNLHGWLQPAPADGQASWVDSDMLTLTTRTADSTATTNGIAVNGKEYSVQLPSNATGGFELLTLDNAGQPTGDPTSYAFDGTSGTQQSSLDRLNTDLTTALDNQHVTVLLQGWGKLPAITDGSPLQQTLIKLGARGDVIDRFNGTSDGNGGTYALVSGLHSGAGTFQTEESSAERTGKGSLSGLLVRGSSDLWNDYIPFASDDNGPDALADNRYRTLPMLYTPPTPWTDWVRENQTGPLRPATAGENAALAAIVKYATAPAQNWVDISTPCPNAPDPIRGYYCDTNASDIDTLYEEEQKLTYDPADGAANGYTAADFATAQNSLEWEALDAKGVRSSIAQYQTLFGTLTTTGAVDATTIGDKVTDEITRATAVPAQVNMLNVMSAATDMASVIPGVGQAMTFMSGVFSLASALVPDSSTQPSLPTVAQISKDNAVSELTDDYQSASQSLSDDGDYIVSDPAKLLQLGDLLKGPMALGTTTPESFVWAGETGATQFLWGSIMGSVYAEWNAPVNAGKGTWYTNPECWYGGHYVRPFDTLDDATGEWLGQVPGAAPDAGKNIWWLGPNAATNPIATVLAKKGTAPPASITQPLFTPVDPNIDPLKQAAVGEVMPYFALDYLPFQTMPIEDTPDKYPGSCSTTGQ